MANCLGYALHGPTVPKTPDQDNYTALRTAMKNPPYAGQLATWDNASKLLAGAMGGTTMQKDAGTAFVNAERGVTTLVYHKKTTTDPGPGDSAPLQTIVKGAYTKGGSGEHYFRNTSDGWRGVAASGKPVKPVQYNGVENNFKQEVPDSEAWTGAVNGWWQ
jgi:hypothetical protein